MTQRQSRQRKARITRDSVLFAAGLAGVFYETVFDRADRPTLLLLFGAMMGLPAFLRSDEQVRSKVTLRRKALEPPPEEEVVASVTPLTPKTPPTTLPTAPPVPKSEDP